MALLTAKGIALDRLSRHSEAQETYRKGLQRDPTDFALLTNLGLSLGLSGRTSEGIRILSELVRDGAATARTRGNLAMVYGLAGREPEAKAVLSIDLSPAQVQNNLSYYRELRAMMQKGKPIGNFDQPGQPTRTARAAAPSATAGQPAGGFRAVRSWPAAQRRRADQGRGGGSAERDGAVAGQGGGAGRPRSRRRVRSRRHRAAPRRRPARPRRPPRSSRRRCRRLHRPP